jgi:glycerol-3-phosphate dehydrogenase (NAD+)
METLFLSCGIGDLIATCIGGRNRLCAEHFARRCSHHFNLLNCHENENNEKCPQELGTSMQASNLWSQIEKELLNGQKLQGVGTCAEVMNFLQHSKHLQHHPHDFPLFRNIYKVVIDGKCCETLFQWNY